MDGPCSSIELQAGRIRFFGAAKQTNKNPPSAAHDGDLICFERHAVPGADARMLTPGRGLASRCIGGGPGIALAIESQVGSGILAEGTNIGNRRECDRP